MPYKLAKPDKDGVHLPALVVQKLPQLEENWLRVAVYVLSTHSTDPAEIARALHLQSTAKAKEALVFWKGAGLLEDAQTTPTVPELGKTKPRHLTTPEVVAASETDPMIAGLVQECQRLMGGVIPQGDANIYVSLYVTDGIAPDLILLCCAHFAALGKRSARYIERALHSWIAQGITSCELAEQYLAEIARHAQWAQETAPLFDVQEFNKAETRMIAAWHEEYGFDYAMIVEAVSYAGADKKTVRYVNGILRAWHQKGYKTVKDVIHSGNSETQNVQVSNPHAKSVLKSGMRRAPKFKKAEG